MNYDDWGLTVSTALFFLFEFLLLNHKLQRQKKEEKSVAAILRFRGQSHYSECDFSVRVSGHKNQNNALHEAKSPCRDNAIDRLY